MDKPHTYFALRGIRAHCLARQWTGYELAKRSGLPYQVAYRILQQKSPKPSFEVVARVAAALELSLDALASNQWPRPE